MTPGIERDEDGREKNRGRFRPLLEIEDLHVHYKARGKVVYALNGLNLKVERGEKLGLVGETGAGKTTMALSILRLLPEKSARSCPAG